MKFKINPVWISLIWGAVCFFSVSCNNPATTQKAQYIELSIKNKTKLYLTENLVAATYALKYDNTVIVTNDTKGVWKMDLNTGEAEIIFTHGAGPNQIYLPGPLVRYEDNIYIKSLVAAKYLFYFSIKDVNQKEIKRLPIGSKGLYAYDDLAFVAKSTVAMSFPYWKDELIRYFDLEKKELLKRGSGSSTKIELMNTFNINNTSLFFTNNQLYAVESINPELKVVSPETFEVVESLKLTPPFFVSLHSVSNKKVSKFSDKELNAWMAKWSAIIDIYGKADWLLVTYKWGYEERYNYELINLKNTQRRYYIKETASSVYDFDVDGNNIVFWAQEQVEDGLEWQKWNAEFSL